MSRAASCPDLYTVGMSLAMS